MTNERGGTETPEERAARVQAAKDRAAAAHAARESGQPPPAAQPAVPAQAAAGSPPPVEAAPAPVLDDRPRTASGQVKRDPDAPKLAPPATPEERAARIATAKEAAARAKAAGGTVTARPAAARAEATPDAVAEESAAAAPSDGILRTAKGTIKRDPDAPKLAPPATPEERAARVAAAKATAAAAKERAKSVPEGTASALGKGPAVAAAGPARATGPSTADLAAFRQAYEAVIKPLKSAGEQPLRAVAAARAERAVGRAEFELTPAALATVAAFQEVFAELEIDLLTSPTDPVFVVDKRDIYQVLRACKTHPKLAMNFFRGVTGVDLLDEGIEVVYHLKSLTTRHAVTVKTLLPPDDLVVPSVSNIWRAANWHEREMMEMFGVVCAGHPDPRNLLLDEDLTIHPLLKAHPLQELELRQGVNIF